MPKPKEDSGDDCTRNDTAHAAGNDVAFSGNASDGIPKDPPSATGPAYSTVTSGVPARIPSKLSRLQSGVLPARAGESRDSSARDAWSGL